LISLSRAGSSDPVISSERKEILMDNVRFLLAGDTSLTVEFGNEISEAINANIRAFNIALTQSGIPGIVETVPTYRSLMVYYDPEVIRYGPLVEKLKGVIGGLDQIRIPPSDVLEIPVLYGGEEGPDLDFVAEHSGKSREEVIRIHTSTEYLIYMLGFTPGFTYLGGMSDEIATPRLKTPRVKIPAGSVGIAGSQTGVYPIDSPGGWQLIGRTPVRMYDPGRTTPILPEAGQYIKFYAIDKAEYDRIAALEAAGGYTCKRHPRKEAGK
jgi:KipI family sensor histidine kinase inhibitor